MSWNPCMICRAIKWHEDMLLTKFYEDNVGTIREAVDGFVARFATNNYNKPNYPCEKHEHDFTASLLRIGG